MLNAPSLFFGGTSVRKSFFVHMRALHDLTKLI